MATLPLPGQVECGDLSLVKRVGKGTLIAVVDGLGHGEEAASAAHAAVGALDRHAREPLADLVRRCDAAMSECAAWCSDSRISIRRPQR